MKVEGVPDTDVRSPEAERAAVRREREAARADGAREGGGSTPRRTRSGRGRGPARMLGEIGLTVGAIAGLVCILFVIAAAVFDLRIILFSTGSMGPTIPAGSAAVIQMVPAEDIELGDVVTVERPGRMPITHRVIDVSPSSDDARRLISMRGDANPVDDPFPYDIERAGRVLVSVPGVAPTISALGSPWVLGGLTVGAAGLVLWAFWPRRPDRPARGSSASTRAGALSLVVAALALGGALPAVTPPAAHASTTQDGAGGGTDGDGGDSESDPTLIEGRVLRLLSIPDEDAQSLRPGDRVVWEVGVWTEGAASGSIDVSLQGEGDIGLGLREQVSVCAVPWQGSECPAERHDQMTRLVSVDGAERRLATMPADEQRWFRVAVSMPANVSSPTGVVHLTVRAEGAGDDAATSPVDVAGRGLPVTGGGGTIVPLAIAAVALLGTGALILVRGRRRPGGGGRS